MGAQRRITVALEEHGFTTQDIDVLLPVLDSLNDISDGLSEAFYELLGAELPVKMPASILIKHGIEELDAALTKIQAIHGVMVQAERAMYIREQQALQSVLDNPILPPVD